MPEMVPTVTQVSRPFFTSDEISYLHLLTISESLRVTYLKKKHQVFLFSFQIVRSLKFPLRVLGTSMNYFQRFYLFHRFSDSAHEVPGDAGIAETDPMLVAVACIFLASKNEDCIKKLRDVQLCACKAAGWDQRPDFTLSSLGPKDSATFLERQRRSVMSLEFKLLQLIKFDFLNGHSLLNIASLDVLVVQFCKKLDIPYKPCLFAWLMAFDVFPVLLVLLVPPHCIAMALVIVTLNLKPVEMKASSSMLDAKEEAASLARILDGIDCYAQFRCPESLVNEAIIYVLNFYIHHMQLLVLSEYIPTIDTESGKEQLFKFMDLKLRFNDLQCMDGRIANSTMINDEYLKVWDFSNALKGCTRFMLLTKRRRFNRELHASKMSL